MVTPYLTPYLSRLQPWGGSATHAPPFPRVLRRHAALSSSKPHNSLEFQVNVSSQPEQAVVITGPHLRWFFFFRPLGWCLGNPKKGHRRGGAEWALHFPALEKPNWDGFLSLGCNVIKRNLWGRDTQGNSWQHEREEGMAHKRVIPSVFLGSPAKLPQCKAGRGLHAEQGTTTSGRCGKWPFPEQTDLIFLPSPCILPLLLKSALHEQMCPQPLSRLRLSCWVCAALLCLSCLYGTSFPLLQARETLHLSLHQNRWFVSKNKMGWAPRAPLLS